MRISGTISENEKFPGQGYFFKPNSFVTKSLLKESFKKSQHSEKKKSRAASSISRKILITRRIFSRYQF